MSDSPEFKNGFNYCIELHLKNIHQAMVEKRGTHESIYSVLLQLKKKLLDGAFKK